MRQLFKQAVYCVAAVLLAPAIVCELLARALLRRDVFFSAQAEMMSLLPGKIGYMFRNVYLRFTLDQCPLDCCILFGALFSHSDARIGHRVYIGSRCQIGHADIGDDTMLADGVQLLSGGKQHGTAQRGTRFQDQAGEATRITVGSNSWIGSGAIVMANVGSDCIIGAGSVVTKPIPDGQVAVGNPARVIRSTFGPAAEPVPELAGVRP